MKALVVDDDRALADLVAFSLQREGIQVTKAFNGRMAWQAWQAERPDFVVLDVNLPDTDGFTLCRRMRAEADVPIIMLTVRGEDDDVVRGLELGADDYVHKPFSPRQLVARIQAVLRRAGKPAVPALMQVGDLALDLDRRIAHIGPDISVQLTSLEARLLNYLMLNAGHVLTTEAILDQVWGAEGADRDMLRQLIRRLRRKIEPDPAKPSFIETVFGVGYCLARLE